jgi:hypothetical protein
MLRAGIRLCMVRRMRRSTRLRLVLQLVLCAVVAVLLVAVAGVTATLLLAPAALLVMTLLAGRYPGERVIHRLRRRSAVVRVAPSLLVPRAPRLLGARLPALAVPGCGRAPPASALI